jgi:hypothetical protein
LRKGTTPEYRSVCRGGPVSSGLGSDHVCRDLDRCPQPRDESTRIWINFRAPARAQSLDRIGILCEGDLHGRLQEVRSLGEFGVALVLKMIRRRNGANVGKVIAFHDSPFGVVGPGRASGGASSVYGARVRAIRFLIFAVPDTSLSHIGTIHATLPLADRAFTSRLGDREWHLDRHSSSPSDHLAPRAIAYGTFGLTRRAPSCTMFATAPAFRPDREGGGGLAHGVPRTAREPSTPPSSAPPPLLFRKYCCSNRL